MGGFKDLLYDGSPVSPETADEFAFLDLVPKSELSEYETVRLQTSIAHGLVSELETELEELHFRVRYYSKTLTQETLEELLRDVRYIKRTLE